MIVPSVTNFFQAVVVSVAAGLMALVSFVPALVGAVIILVAGWLISDFVASLCLRLLERTGFESAALRAGVAAFIARTGMRDPRASVLLAELARWFIRLIFLEAAAQAIHLQAVVQVINQLIFFIPNLAVALVVLLIGLLAGRVAAGAARASAEQAGFENPVLIAGIAKYTVLAFAVIVAVNQIGIAASIVNILFMAFAGSVALALGLAFGLGGRDVAGRVWQNAYDRGRAAGPRLRAPEASTAPATALESEPARQADVEYGGVDDVTAAPTQEAERRPPRRRTRMRPSVE
jgi:hypothetical protein